MQWVKTLLKENGLSTHEICITPNKSAIRTALSDADLPVHVLKDREVDPGSEEPGIRVGTMKRIKGLEFRAVAMACASKSDPMNHLESAEVRDRCERYVAATRAREHLMVTVYGTNEK